MPNFVFTYHGPKGYERTPDSTAAWMAWFDTMGDQLVDLGKPVAQSRVLGNCDAASTDLGGYSVISADDLESALQIAKGCPHLSNNGGIEVGELRDVEVGHLAARQTA